VYACVYMCTHMYIKHTEGGAVRVAMANPVFFWSLLQERHTEIGHFRNRVLNS